MLLLEPAGEVLIVSKPPIASATVKTEASVSLSPVAPPNGWVFECGEWISPESPRITFVPVPPITESSSAPAITRLAPSPSWMSSLPPMPGLVETAWSMKSPASLQSMYPPSPKTRFVPEPVWMKSPLSPPKATLEPLPVVIVSIPPMPSSSVSM